MSELAGTLDPTADDRLLQAEGFVRSYCGWHIAPERSEDLILDGSGGRDLLLPSLHVVTLDAVTENGTLLVEATDYTWSQAGIVRRIGTWVDSIAYGYTAPVVGWWTNALQGIAVTLTHGFADVPPDVTAVVQGIASRLVDNPTGLEQQTVGPFSEKYAPGGVLSNSDLATLNAYRLPKRP